MRRGYQAEEKSLDALHIDSRTQCFSCRKINMASRMLSMLFKVSAARPLSSSFILLPVRFKTHRQLPTKKRINPFVQKRTDLIKKLVIALVKHERLQTTLHKAQQLQKYGDLVGNNIFDYTMYVFCKCLCTQFVQPHFTTVFSVLWSWQIEADVYFISGTNLAIFDLQNQFNFSWLILIAKLTLASNSDKKPFYFVHPSPHPTHPWGWHKWSTHLPHPHPLGSYLLLIRDKKIGYMLTCCENVVSQCVYDKDHECTSDKDYGGKWSLQVWNNLSSCK